MKIPKNKLPLLLGHLGAYRQYTIGYSAGKYAGGITGKDLAKYVITATNNFETALTLLELSLAEFHRNEDEDTLNLALLISQFINKLKRDE